MPRDTVWPLEPHTQAKIELLRQYLNGWIPVIATWNGRVVFLDGFAGPGRYSGSEPGSPIVALTTLLEHTSFARLRNRHFVFLFVESDSRRVESLETEIAALKEHYQPWPEDVKVQVMNSKFESAVDELLRYLREQKANLAPTLAFVDPFGFSGMPMSLLSQLTAYNQCEVVVNFMYDHINRFASAGNVDPVLTDLFGTDEYLSVEHHADRETFLHDLYQRQLETECSFRYVRSFSLDTGRGRTGYYLLHGTRHLKGLELMRDAMWKVDPGGGRRFSSVMAGQSALFDDSAIDYPRVRQLTLERFRGKTVDIARLEAFILEETIYRKPILRKGLLTPLEDDGRIVVNRPAGKTRQFPQGTTITFPA